MFYALVFCAACHILVLGNNNRWIGHANTNTQYTHNSHIFAVTKKQDATHIFPAHRQNIQYDFLSHCRSNRGDQLFNEKDETIPTLYAIQIAIINMQYLCAWWPTHPSIWNWCSNAIQHFTDLPFYYHYYHHHEMRAAKFWIRQSKIQWENASCVVKNGSASTFLWPRYTIDKRYVILSVFSDDNSIWILSHRSFFMEWMPFFCDPSRGLPERMW